LVFANPLTLSENGAGGRVLGCRWGLLWELQCGALQYMICVGASGVVKGSAAIAAVAAPSVAGAGAAAGGIQ
jgi:hypothetical protein